MRIYSPQSLINLPRLTALTTHSLAMAVITAGLQQAETLEAQNQALPDLLERALKRLQSATAELERVLAPAVSSSDPGATREADLAVDRGWSGMHSLLTAWGVVPAPNNPDPEGVAALMELLFADGLSFVQRDYRSEWSESQTRLEALATAPWSDTIARLGAGPMVDTIRQAHETYGKVLGTTAVLPAEAAAELRVKRDAVQEALREYVVKAVAWADPEASGSQDLSDALLEPIEAWTSPEPSSSGSKAAAPAGSTSAGESPASP